MKRVHTRKRLVLLRGLRKLCPHCGQGPLFRRWVTLHEHCPACHLKHLRNSGDPWGFLLLIDRASLIFPLIVALFFGLHRASGLLFAGFTAVLSLLVVLTLPRRYGLCVALDYLTRVYWGDPSDVLPELPPADRAPGPRLSSGS